MWHPKQHLKPPIIDALFLGGFTKLEVEFLGWLSYNAAALNNSRNPVKAAHTILSNASDPDHKLSGMLETFRLRKVESIRPKNVAKHDESDAIFRKLQSDISDEVTRATMLATGYEDFTAGGVSDGEPAQDGEPGEATEEDGE